MTVLPTVKIGFIAPLSAPGWKEAGEQLLGGFMLGIDHATKLPAWIGQRVEVVVRDTAGTPARAEAAVREMKAQGVVALSGEYHSLVARVAARTAHDLRLPYLCSSAVIDELVDTPSNWVARLSPPQSAGWSLYADFLIQQGHRQVAAILSQGAYWESGARILRDRLKEHGVQMEWFSLYGLISDQIVSALADLNPSVILLLLGFPEPIISTVRTIRSRPNFEGVMLGTPAGQSEFLQWHRELGEMGERVPFLRYMPASISHAEGPVLSALRRRLGCEPTFVALEGLDSARAILNLLKHQSFTDTSPWARVVADGTRGRVEFVFDPGRGVWQWTKAPFQVACLDSSPSRFPRVLLSSNTESQCLREISSNHSSAPVLSSTHKA